MFLGLRTVNYPASDLDAAKAWWTAVLGIEPYFDEPFYVGYNVGGFELGLNPGLENGPITYWGVPDADAAVAELVAAGAQPGDAVAEVGDGIRVATVLDPSGAVVGVIENPHFVTPDAPSSPGPGR